MKARRAPQPKPVAAAPAPTQHSRGAYAYVRFNKIRDLMTRLSRIEYNAMDLIPEANLLRALTIDFINRYEEFSDALMAWYHDPESNTKPRRVMDISDASYLIESISRVVERLHRIQSQGAISLETFKRITERMGMIVANHVADPETLNKIEAEWMALSLDAKEPPTPADTVE